MSIVGDAKYLSHNSYSVEIESYCKRILTDISVRIRDTNKNNQNTLIYELPFYFEHLLSIIENDILSIDDLRTIVWGVIVESLLKKNYNVSINVSKQNETCNIEIKWVTSLSYYSSKIDRYKTLLNDCSK